MSEHQPTEDTNPAAEQAHGRDILQNGVLPFSVIYTAANLLETWSDKMYSDIEGHVSHDPKTLISLVIAGVGTAVYNKLKNS